MKSQPKIIHRILNRIREAKNICVAGHVRPDGDCIGSQLGLTLALRAEGYAVTCWNQDPLPQKLKFLDPNHLVQTPEPGRSFDCVIALDSASPERMGIVCDSIPDSKVHINIDHHSSNTRYAEINWISAREPSTGELVFHLLTDAKWTITKQIANCLFTAISTDTGSFQYPSTRPSTYQIAGELVKKGADLALICDEVYQSYPLTRMRLLRHVYNNFRLTHNNQIAYFWLRQEDYKRTGATRADTEGLIDHVRSIDPVIVACLFEEETKDITRISLRSKSDQVNVNTIAEHFGGGGHKAAAGARVEGRPLTVQRNVVAAIRRSLDHSY